MKVLSIIRKDLITVLSDKKALAIILVMPIILMVILGFALKGIFVDDLAMNKVNVAIVKQYNEEADNNSFRDSLKSGLLAQGMGNQETGQLTSATEDTDPEKIFFDDFLGSDEVSDIISYRIETEEVAKELLSEGKVSVIVLLPEKYVYNMKVNLLTPFRNEVRINLLTDPDNSLDGQIVQSIMKSYSDSMSSIIIGKNVLIESAMANNLGNGGFADMKTVVGDITDSLESVRLEVNDIALEGKNPVSSTDYYAAAMLTMFILFAAGHGGRMLLEEKENTSYQRMMIAGTSKVSILASKFLTIFLIALLQIAVMMVFSRFVLKVIWGDWLSVILIGISAAFAVAGVGIAIASVTYRAGNYKMASIFESVIIQGMAMIGGSFIPLDILPSIFQKLSYLSLNGVALKAYQKTMMGYGLEAVTGYIMILAGFGAAFAVLSLLILKEKGGSIDGKCYQTETIKA